MLKTSWQTSWWLCQQLQCANFRVLRDTVWNFLDFSIIQTLREINFKGFRSEKSAILPHLEAMNLDFL